MVPRNYLFNSCHTEVGLLNNIEVGIEAVSFNVFAEDIHVLLDFGEVCEAFLSRISVLVHSHISDGSVVYVAKDEALAFVWGEVGHAFLRHFAEL